MLVAGLSERGQQQQNEEGGRRQQGCSRRPSHTHADAMFLDHGVAAVNSCEACESVGVCVVGGVLSEDRAGGSGE